jgi:hypothetical protein
MGTNIEQTDTDFRTPVVREMREMEIYWQTQGYAFSWIDLEPTFEPAGSWDCLFTATFDDAFPRPKEPCIRIMRFSLLGGGQIRTKEHFKASDDTSWPGLETWSSETELKVTAHTEGGIVLASGEIFRIVYEMQAEAVVLRWNCQAIADRTAATFRLINNKADNFFALMDGSEGCAICGRPLRDEISKLIGVGPECAHKYGVPHSRQAAERRLTLRRKLLQEGTESSK